MDPVTADQVLGEDGSLNDNWRDLVFEEDNPLRTDPTLANIKNIRGLAHQIVSGESTIGKMSGGREFVILPNENSDDAEKAEFRTKMNVPADVAGYGLGDMELPEGLPKNEKLNGVMGAIMHKAGASKETVLAIARGYADYIKESTDEAAQHEKLVDQENDVKLRKLLGGGYDRQMQLAANAANAFGSEIDADETAALIKDLPYMPFYAQLLAKAGAVIAEKKPGEEPIPAGELTPADLQIEINKIMADPYYVTSRPKDKPFNQAYHEDLVEKVRKLFEAKNPTG